MIVAGRTRRREDVRRVDVREDGMAPDMVLTHPQIAAS